ncbi:ferritin-like domain-containing protein [Falsiroseomonas oryziterrae]|uniref:ferritin-like domain-containing protein n=1 Tax=Falsiroseomonas oryziterrae TaxID=2911368 RepID=UPI001F23DD2E|nr:ferritin-like domain-containing protein [Roseomonas sp. NPKOSM-4]
MDEITKLMVEQLKDAYSAEKQALRAMPKMMKNATNERLKQGFQMHIDQTEGQVERVEQALELLGAKPGRKVCEAMRGLIEEASHEIEENDRGAMMDVVLIAAAQRIEHYEIAAYGTMASLAKAAGMAELGEMLGQTLAEEKRMDEELTRLAESEVNMAFIEEARSEMEEQASNENRRGGARRRAS